MRQPDFERMIGEMECVIDTVLKFSTEWKDELIAMHTDFFTEEQSKRLSEIQAEFDKNVSALEE